MNPEGDCPLNRFLLSGLEEIESRGLTRSLSALEGPQQTKVVRNGCELLNFSSNDYLGLAAHPALKLAAMAEWERSGFGSGSSRLICGTLAAHEELDHAIAEFKQTEAALSFSSGYAAAMGTIPALCGAGDVIILDKLSHACLVDAARLSGAVLRVFPHNDLGKLESHLKWAASKYPDGKKLIIAESIYSMDGDRAPLREIVDLKERHGAWIFLDEAHAVGVIGRQGRGLADEEGVADHIEIQMGTLGKALGCHGAYIAGSTPLRDFLINRARSFIFSTSPPAPVAAASRKAIEIAASPEGDALRAKLWSNLRYLQSLLSRKDAASAIFPILIGDESKAVETSKRLLHAGFLIPAIRFPTVAKGSSRLRVTLTATHLPSEIEALVQALSL
ncbi:MAG: 8-amino-7-oxononanoate synthase [Spartobacteria bacterium AMD-G4]|nr:MAG: 8-amino-7-oxononanoate synthase [Spartobacteria bacterium AMD-G4]